MRLRILLESWNEFEYTVQQWIVISTNISDWTYVHCFRTQEEAEEYCERRMKGPVIVKEYDPPGFGR
jgi:hypothetical protein